MVKKIPLRSCCACREKRPKRELMRVVRTPDGTVLPDSTGKVSGRGVYLCRSAACIARAQKTRALQRALEIEIPQEVFRALEEAIIQNE